MAEFVRDDDRFIFSALTACDIYHFGWAVEETVYAFADHGARRVLIKLEIVFFESGGKESGRFPLSIASDKRFAVIFARLQSDITPCIHVYFSLNQ
jgi:hypothetical protein